MREIEVNLIRGQVVKRLMGALNVVKPKPLAKALPQLGTGVKRPQILILERPPQALNKNIVLDTATTVHADSHIVQLE